MDIEQARTNMISQQLRPTSQLDDRQLQTWRDIPREDFVPEEYRHLAFADTFIPLAHRQVMLRPYEECRMLAALNPQAHERVLEIGTGSGYTAALFANLSQHVTTVDIFDDFCVAASKRLRDLDFANVLIEIGDAAQGWQSKQLFDVIAITAAFPVLPDAYRQNLTLGGRCFVITGQAPAMQACLITRTHEDTWQTAPLFETVVPSMLHSMQPSVFKF